MANRLANETSPYLAQHAENPVDWYPWGPEALERARREDKPILLSIGYAACHWCHVMAHESFEDEETARLMNEQFVNIKVDREERPDLDAIYMQATQAMTGHGGWPMTVFLTPETVPFYTGTYFPPRDRHGMPSFRRVLQAVAEAYRDRRSGVEATAAKMRELYANVTMPAAANGQLTATTLDRAYRAIAQRYDARYGGFDGAPKFPQAMTLDFLLRYSRRTGTDYALEMAATSFRRMARGGIYDQLGGGFHRYAVDAVWLVPHFEKMLYDNALLTRLGAHLWQATRDPETRRVTEETIDWVARDMTSSDGGFYSSLDADSEGHEGTFYVWTREEIERALGGDAKLAMAYWGVTDEPNFEGKYILHVPHETTVVAARAGVEVTAVTESVANARALLRARRERRERPGRDEKVLAAWNGLMLRGIVEAARAFNRDDYRALAVRHALAHGRGDTHRRVSRGPCRRRSGDARSLQPHVRASVARRRAYHRERHGRVVLGRERWRVLRHREGPRAPADAAARGDGQRGPVRDVAGRRPAAAIGGDTRERGTPRPRLPRARDARRAGRSLCTGVRPPARRGRHGGARCRGGGPRR
jgi:uncharacterized protein YyaL (SSP411 family)